MNPRLILLLLQLLTSQRGRGLLAGLVILMLAPLALASSVVPLVIPLASDGQLQDYQDVADGMPVPVDWKAVIAVDAVQYHQDFSEVDLAKVADTALKFMACENVHDNYPTSFSASAVGESTSDPVVLSQESDVSWEVHTTEGSVTVEFLTSDGEPAGSGHHEAGGYELVITATEAPTSVYVNLSVDSVVCHGRQLEGVLDDLGLDEEEREMVLALINAFNTPGPMPFAPHPESVYAWPVNGLITSFFGPRIDPVDGGWRPHFGVDIAATEGTPVDGAAVGYVAFAGQHETLGNMVRIQHDGYETVYGHLKWIYVTPGELVVKGQEIGAVGSTGKSTGPHLHFEWWVEGEAIDPLYFYR